MLRGDLRRLSRAARVARGRIAQEFTPLLERIVRWLARLLRRGA